MCLQYESLVDIYARQRRAKPVYRVETSYGQLQHILYIELPASAFEDMNISDPKDAILILTAIRSCTTEPDDPRLHGLDIHFYSTTGTLDIVDMVNVQCLVGRVKDAGTQWAVIDRSGPLARYLRRFRSII